MAIHQALGLLFSLAVAAALALTFVLRPLPPMPPTELRIQHLLMLDVLTIGERLVSVGQRGQIFISDDHGQQWQRVDSPTTATLTALAQIDAQRLVAVGHDSVILLSDDGGEHWQVVFSQAESEEPLLAVYFYSAYQGIAVGAYGRYLYSYDGGQTWMPRSLNGEDMHFNALARVGASLLLAGEAGTLLRSDDGGEHWYTLDSPYVGSFFGLLPLADDRVLVYWMRGQVYHSADAGETWQAVVTHTQSAIFGGWANAQQVLLTGHNGLLLYSADAGMRFKPVDTASSRSFTRITASGRPAEWLLIGEQGGKHWSLRDTLHSNHEIAAPTVSVQTSHPSEETFSLETAHPD